MARPLKHEWDKTEDIKDAHEAKLEYLRKLQSFRRKFISENERREKLGIPLLNWPLPNEEYDASLAEVSLAMKTLKQLEKRMEQKNKRDALVLADKEDAEQRLATISDIPASELTDQQRIIRHNLMLAKIGWSRRIDITQNGCAEEMLNRFQEYLALCVENNIVPTIEGFYISIGWSQVEANKRQSSGKTSKEYNETISYVKQILCSQIIDNGQNGKANPIFTIFQLRNNYGYTNDDKMNADKNALPEKAEERDAAEIAEKYSNLPD